MKEENVMQGQFSVEEKTVKGQARAAEENGGMKEMTDGEKTDTGSATLKKRILRLRRSLQDAAKKLNGLKSF